MLNKKRTVINIYFKDNIAVYEKRTIFRSYFQTKLNLVVKSLQKLSFSFKNVQKLITSVMDGLP